MRKTRFAALLLSLALALSLAVPAAAYNPSSLVPQKRTYSTPFSDTKGTWCEAAVRTCYEAGLLDGTSKTTFSPTAPLTYAQITVITARLHELLNGGDGVFPAPAGGEAWYAPAEAYLLEHMDQESEAGSYVAWLLQDEAPLSYLGDVSCPRMEFVWFLAAVLPKSALTPINHITLLPDSSDADVLRFYNAGILTGSNAYGTFNGYDELNRGQAAAMLARLADPSLRVKFTPKTLVASQEILGLAPDTTVLTVDGFDVSAELYTRLLTGHISSAISDAQYSYYDEYPEYYEAWFDDQNFDGSFLEYLIQHGVEVHTSVNWDTPDKGGMTPAQKVRADTLAEIKSMAVLMNHQSEYPLTAVQRAELQTGLRREYGYSVSLTEQMDLSMYLMGNLSAKQDLTSSQLKKALEEQGYIYGLSAELYRGFQNGSYTYATDTDAKKAAEDLRRQMDAHLDDSEYLEYLIWKQSETYGGTPDLISLTGLSSANQTTLKNLGYNKVSPVLTEPDRYLVVVRLDPSKDETVTETMTWSLAMVQLEAWAEKAQVTTTAVYDAVNVAKAAAVYDNLGIY